MTLMTECMKVTIRLTLCILVLNQSAFRKKLFIILFEPDTDFYNKNDFKTKKKRKT